MVNRYLMPDDPEAHLDFPPLIVNEHGVAINAIPPGFVTCPKCGGWGGHNLKINAYPLRPEMADTPVNRHNYGHFRASCDQCASWGYVYAKDASCVHEWGFLRNVGNCLNIYTCIKCGCEREVDSSG